MCFIYVFRIPVRDGHYLIRIDLTPFCLSASPFYFFVCRVGSEHVSEVKSFLRSSRLRDGVVSLRVEDIKKAIKSLNEACVISLLFLRLVKSEGVLDDFPDSPQTHIG